MRMKCACSAMVAIVVSGSAHAEAFNLDFGPQASVPFLDYGGAADQPGIWSIPTADGTPIEIPSLFDLTFTPTDVSMYSNVRVLDFGFNNPATTGDDGKLLDDAIDLGEPDPTRDIGLSLSIENLDPGAYEVYVYAWSPDLPFSEVAVGVNDLEPQLVGGGQFNGELVQGLTHSMHSVTIDDGRMNIDLTVVSGFGSLNGLQIKPIPAPGALALFGLAGLGCRRRSRRTT